MVNVFRLSKLVAIASMASLAFVSRTTLFPFITGKYVLFRALIDIAIVLFAAGLLAKKGLPTFLNSKERVLARLKTPLVIALGVFTLVFLVASFTGIDPHASFWSNFERGEGALQVLHLFAFFLLLVLLVEDEAEWRGIFKFAIAIGALSLVYGILGYLKYIGAEFNAAGQITRPGGWYRLFGAFIGPRWPGRFQASLGNPAYVGIYMVFLMAYAGYLFLYARTRATKIRYGALIGCFFIGFWLSQTRGAFLGLIAGIGAFALYLALWGKGEYRKIARVSLIGVILIVGFLFAAVRAFPPLQTLPGARLLNISLTDRTAETRFWTWGSAMKGVAERPLLGWGPENFPVVFDKYFDSRHFITPGSETWFDRAHNVFIDYLVEIGVIGLLAYVGIFAVWFLRLAKISKAKPDEKPSAERIMSRGLLSALMVAYLVQGLLLFDVLPIYINLMLLLAFTNYKFYVETR